MTLRLSREEVLCSGPAAYKTSGARDTLASFKLPDGAVIGGSIYYYSKAFAIDGHRYYHNYKITEVLAHGVIHSVDGLRATIGWLRMVHRSQRAGFGALWEKGDLAEGGMDAFRDVTLGGPGYQLIPIFRWQAPDEALALLNTIFEQRPLPVQINDYEVECGSLKLSLSLLSGAEFETVVAAVRQCSRRQTTY
jgi:hypothetical protein